MIHDETHEHLERDRNRDEGVGDACDPAVDHVSLSFLTVEPLF
jgi:hypothetical protein